MIRDPHLIYHVPGVKNSTGVSPNKAEPVTDKVKYYTPVSTCITADTKTGRCRGYSSFFLITLTASAGCSSIVSIVSSGVLGFS